MKNRFAKILLSTCLVLALSGFGAPSFDLFSFLFGGGGSNEMIGTDAWVVSEMNSIHSQASNLDSHVLELSLKAYAKAREEGMDSKQILTIIDYTKPSTEHRLWVVDLKSNRVLFNTWVAHGKNSGELVPTAFSNSSGSLESSLGVYSTAQTYFGKDGYSLRLVGLEHGINDNAYRRAIVMHGAWYVGDGQTGRSWGCPAVNKELAQPIIDTIKNKTLVFVYGNDRRWLNHSSFLT